MAVAVFATRVLPPTLAAAMAVLAAGLSAFHNAAMYEAATRLLQHGR